VARTRAPGYTTRSFYCVGNLTLAQAISDGAALQRYSLDSGEPFPITWTDPWDRPFVQLPDDSPEALAATQLVRRGHDGKRADVTAFKIVPRAQGPALLADYYTAYKGERWFMIPRGDCTRVWVSGGPDGMLGGGNDLALDPNRLYEQLSEAPDLPWITFCQGCVVFLRPLALCAALSLAWAAHWRRVPRDPQPRTEVARGAVIVGGWSALGVYVCGWTPLGFCALGVAQSTTGLGGWVPVALTLLGVFALAALGLRATLPTADEVAAADRVSPSSLAAM